MIFIWSEKKSILSCKVSKIDMFLCTAQNDKKIEES
jgi:hypothetical protein